VVLVLVSSKSAGISEESKRRPGKLLTYLFCVVKTRDVLIEFVWYGIVELMQKSRRYK
jgi:hypothetical protein